MTDTSSGVAIVVWRRNPRLEVLLLHRSMFGQSFAGDWAWTTPGGAREPGETAATTAARELFEETGLRLTCIPVISKVATAQPAIDVEVFTAEAEADQIVNLSDEIVAFESPNAIQPAQAKSIAQTIANKINQAGLGN